MYTALFVDDEKAVLDNLLSNIAWNDFGVSSILTASDGKEALKEMEAHPVDLLITDIRMPHMDGLELLGIVRVRYPETRCIVLTAYGEFEYARQALSLGVENYLLKPFQQSELEDTVEKALDNLYLHRRNTENLFRENLLLRWVKGTIESEELAERAGLLNINTFQSCYCAVCLYKLGKGCSSRAFRSAFQQFLPHGSEIHALWDDAGHYVMIVGSSALQESSLLEAARKAIADLHYQDLMVAAIGTVVLSSDDLAESYRTANRILDIMDHSDHSCPVLTQSLCANTRNDSLVRKLLDAFHIEGVEERETSYQKLTSWLLAQYSDQDVLLTALSHSLIQLFRQEFPEKSGIQEQIYHRVSRFSPPAENFEGAVRDLLEYSCLLFRYCFEQLSPVIRHAVDYIHAHYSEGLSIKEFCVKYKMNTAYLGFLFRKETGMFFNNYLTQYRICSAILLLQETDRHIGDIAADVGFSSTSYFISCFKKQTGLSPIKFRSTKGETL